ncbi:SRPBCC family protein [Desertivirga xinjiangensis]|uniref:SRPBCC family protein n=1 Tax=Desertivirga xinjiangensis TaxID=539206 RepID=UPI00210B34B0|nr:SRPBCC domain-containing protein [Pedobacter xinjiangensis]
MENFDWTSFTKRIAVKSDLKTIYDAWTKASELEKWFLKEVTFFNADESAYDANLNVSNNTRYQWYWYLYKDPMIGIIEEANGKDFIRFTFEGDCLVDVSLEEKEGYVVITLRHYNIPTDDYSRQFVRLGCSNGWTFYLTNLKSVYEGGIDLRNKDESLGAMINN